MEDAARRRQAPPRPAGRGGRAADDRQPRAAQRPRPRDPRRDRRDPAAADRGIETRCVLITGAPPLFSAGYDIAGIPEETFERDAEALVAHPFHAAMEAIARHPWPTIAAINGHCLGGGLELAITCDLRICAAGAKLGMPPAKLGLIYGHTGLRKFLDTIGLSRTRRSSSSPAATSRPSGPSGSASSTRSSPTPRWRTRRSRWPRRSPPTRRSRCAATSRRSTSSSEPRTDRAAGGRPGRPARILLLLGGLPRGDPRLRREAPAAVDRPVSAKARKALAAADPTMAALIERIGKIDIEDPAEAPQRGAAARRLRGPAAGDRRPAALDQSGADDLPARARPLRRRHPDARSSCSRPPRRTCAPAASPGARPNTSATSPPTSSAASWSSTGSRSSATRR